MRPVLAVLALVIVACTGVGSQTTSPSTGTGGWVEVAADPVPRSEHPAAVMGGEVVVLGGFVEEGFGDQAVTDEVGSFNPSTNSWRSLEALPESRHHGMAAVVVQRLFAIGGYAATGFDPTTDVWELVDGVWVERAPIPAAVGAGAVAVVDDLVYLVGGTPYGVLFRYDPAADTWERLADPALKREHLAAVAIDGEVWALAGRWDGEIFDSTEIYDPATDEWRPGPTMNEARSGFGAVVVDGSIVVVGGEVFDPNLALDSVEMMSGDSWAETDRFEYGIHGHPLVEIDGVVFLPGGSTQPAGVENDGRTFRYDR